MKHWNDEDTCQYIFNLSQVEVNASFTYCTILLFILWFYWIYNIIYNTQSIQWETYHVLNMRNKFPKMVDVSKRLAVEKSFFGERYVFIVSWYEVSHMIPSCAVNTFPGNKFRDLWRTALGYLGYLCVCWSKILLCQHKMFRGRLLDSCLLFRRAINIVL